MAESSSSIMVEALSLLLRWQGDIKSEAVDRLVKRAMELDKAAEGEVPCDCPPGQ